MKMALSQRISAFTSEADKIFNHVLGYVIAFSALIAFADVLGDGKIVQYMPWLFWIWVIAQGLGVEFQVFVLIRRLPRLWTANKGMFWGNIAFILALCVISVLIGSVFVEHDNAGGTINTAMGVLGINHIDFIYARAALAILLVVLIGIDRAMDHEQHEQTQEAQKQNALITAIEARLQAFLLERLSAGLERELTEALSGMRQELQMVSVTVTEQTYVLRQELNTVSSTVEEVANTMEKQTQQLLAMPKISTPTSTVRTQGKRLQVVQSTGETIRDLLSADSTLSVRSLAKQAGVAPATADKWKRRITGTNGHHTQES